MWIESLLGRFRAPALQPGTKQTHPACGPRVPAGGCAGVCGGVLTCMPGSQLCFVFWDLGNVSSAVLFIVGSLFALFYQDEETEVQRSKVIF